MTALRGKVSKRDVVELSRTLGMRPLSAFREVSVSQLWHMILRRAEHVQDARNQLMQLSENDYPNPFVHCALTETPCLTQRQIGSPVAMCPGCHMLHAYFLTRAWRLELERWA